jgi:DNA mismatch repair ATPase MutL
MLSSLTISSKAANCSSTYVKTFEESGTDMDQDFSNLMKSTIPIVNSGTRVRVKQLFENLPARRKALRRNLEIFKVKEFIQRMSILYHDVLWLLVDANSAKTIIKLHTQPSVSARFMHYHGQQGLHKMKVRMHWIYPAVAEFLLS